MHLSNGLLFLSASTTTTTSSTSNSGSSSLFLVVIIALVAAFYFLMIRPNQRRRMQAMRETRAFDVGDEVVAGGMVGHVVRIGDGDVDVEVADGVNITFVSGAVQSRAAYNARPAARGMGGAGLGARPAGLGSRAQEQLPAEQPPRAAMRGPRLTMGPPRTKAPTGQRVAADDGSAGDVTAGEDGGVEPTGEER